MTEQTGIDRPLRATLGIAFLIVLALPFVLYAVEKGFRFSASDERSGSRLFHADAILASALIYTHMISGAFITLLAPLQMSRALRSRWPKVHHICGYAVASAALLTSAAGLFYIFNKGTVGGPFMNLGFAVYGGLMFAAVVQTVRFARQRDPLHSLWAGRLIILALASWLYRVHYGVWEIATGGLGSNPDFSGVFDQVQVFAFYVPYLVIHHFWWHARADRLVLA